MKNFRLQHTGYYPYGEPWREPSGQHARLFAGKERVGGLPEGEYDFGPRGYCSTFLLWDSPDIKATDYPQWSPWLYCGANPIRYIDPTGLSPDDALFAVKFSLGLRFGANVGKVSANIDLGSHNYVWSTDGSDSYISTGLDVGNGVIYFTQDNRYRKSPTTVSTFFTNGNVLNQSRLKEEVTRTSEFGIGFKDAIGASIRDEEKFSKVGNSDVDYKTERTPQLDLIISRDFSPKKNIKVPPSSNDNKNKGSISASINCILGISVEINYGKVLDVIKDRFSSKEHNEPNN